MSLAELAAVAGVAAPDGAGRIAVSGVTLRAQSVLPGDLVVALPSLTAGRRHGADFAEQALAGGAVAVLTDPAGAGRPALAEAPVPVLVHHDPRAVLGAVSAHAYGDPATRLGVLGVTGTSGKTTTTFLLDAGLRAAGLRTGLLGTVQARIGDDVLPSAFTTPEAPDLQALLAVMVERGVQRLCMEVSSHALTLGRVSGVGYSVAGFTNLSQDHLDFHPDMDHYFAAKALLFDGRARREVVCVGDDWGRALAGRRPGATTVGAEDSGWRAVDVRATPDGGQAFQALGPDGTATAMSVRMPGAFNVTNALLAMAMGVADGADPAALAAGIGTAEVPGRMQRVDAGQDFLAVVDYAHKPAAVAALLDAVRAQVPGRVLLVLGCGGDRDQGKRPIMGAEAAARSDLLVVTDDNPRSEDPATIRAAMLAGTTAGAGEVVEIGDRREAIATAVAAARPGDAVVVAGKGHEQGQEVAGHKHPFDDVTVLREALVGQVTR